MSFNGSGTFNINTAGQPVVTGTVISSSVFNALTADLATGLSTCITKDGQTTVTANIPMNSFKFTGLAAGTAATDSVRLGQLQAGAATLITVTGTNTYAGTMTPALSAYAAGNTFSFLVPNTNTTSCTLNIDGLGAKSITRDGTTALVAGDLVANSEVVVVYDGTQFQVLNSNSKTNFNLSGTLTVAGNTTLSGGTANGVAYLNGSKVLTTGSALTFDGTNLGVGTSSPSEHLQVYGAGNQRLLLQSTAASGVAVSTQYKTASRTWEIGQAPGIGDNSFTIYDATAAAVRALFDTSGNLGIGTTSPTSKLSISGGLDFKSYIAHADNFALYANSTDGTTLAAYTGYPITFRIGNSEKMRLDSSGNVGIGTSSPSTVGVSGYTRLVLGAGGSATDGLTIVPSGTGGVQFTDAANVKKGYLQWDSSTGALALGTGGTTKATLDSSGNLGLGVTPSAWGAGFAPIQSSYGILSGNNQATMLANAYYNAGYKYTTTNYAGQYLISGTGQHQWFTAPSGTAGTAISFTQAMTLDSSGNLGIGETSPAERLHLTKSGGLSKIRLDGTASSATNFLIGQGITGVSNGGLEFRDVTNSATRACIDSSGNLLVGTTSAGGNNTTGQAWIYNSGSSYGSLGHITGTGSGTGYLQFLYNGTVIGSVTQNGTTGVLYNITSDYRLKEFVAPVTNAGERIDALNPVEFDWKSDGSRARGFFAHEFQQVYANSVTGEKDGVDADGNPVYQTMQASTAEVIADLVAEIKSLRQRVAQLEVK